VYSPTAHVVLELEADGVIRGGELVRVVRVAQEELLVVACLLIWKGIVLFRLTQ
jgi:hypothetical protein